MFAVIRGDKIRFRSTIISRAEAYRDEHGGIIYELSQVDVEEPDPAYAYWILRQGQRVATFADLGEAIDHVRRNPGCELAKGLLSPVETKPAPTAA